MKGGNWKLCTLAIFIAVCFTFYAGSCYAFYADPWPYIIYYPNPNPAPDPNPEPEPEPEPEPIISDPGPIYKPDPKPIIEYIYDPWIWQRYIQLSDPVNNLTLYPTPYSGTNINPYELPIMELWQPVGLPPFGFLEELSLNSFNDKTNFMSDFTEINNDYDYFSLMGSTKTNWNPYQQTDLYVLPASQKHILYEYSKYFLAPPMPEPDLWMSYGIGMGLGGQGLNLGTNPNFSGSF